MRHDLLQDPLFRIVREGENEQVCLPQALASLSKGEDLTFSALQPHQRHAWHAFLVQLSALALHTDDCASLPSGTETWRELLLHVAGEQPEAWCLVVEELSKPAFFQPPVPEGTLAGFREVGPNADDLDMLVTAANHFVKQSRMAHPTPELWVFALCTLQTMEGFSGRQNYGIARMNGGLSNRPGLSLVPGDGGESAFLRDLAHLRETRARTMADRSYAPGAGLGLLWLQGWAGAKTEALALSALDPWFVEVCRRVRLRGVDGGIEALTCSTLGPRIAPAERKGNTGDYWTPIHRKDGAALTIPMAGFTYRKLQQILFEEDYERNPGLDLQGDLGQSPVLHARALVRGQGKTEGFHERRIPIGKAAARWASKSEGHADLARRSASFVKRAADTQRGVLRVAVCALLQPDREKLDFRDQRKDPFDQAFDEAVDAMYFEELFGHADVPTDEALLLFERRLLTILRDVYEDAVRTIPLPSARRQKAIARADGLFLGLLKKHLRDACEAEAAQRKEASHAR